MLKHVLVTLDGSELAERALPYAKDMVAPGGRITLLSVMDTPEAQLMTLYEVPPMMPPKDYERYVKETEQSIREYLRRTADTLQNETGLTVDYEFTAGDPGRDIIERAKAGHVDAIIMSTHGRSGFSRWLFGSVTQKVLAAMPCPVLVVPGSQAVQAGEHAPQKTRKPLKTVTEN